GDPCPDRPSDRGPPTILEAAELAVRRDQVLEQTVVLLGLGRRVELLQPLADGVAPPLERQLREPGPHVALVLERGLAQGGLERERGHPADHLLVIGCHRQPPRVPAGTAKQLEQLAPPGRLEVLLREALRERGPDLG